MKNTKLIQLLSSLDSQEFKRFHQYIAQRYFDHEIPLKVFYHLANYYPNFESHEIDKQFILDKVLMIKNAPSKRISNEFHKLLEWLLDFLILEHAKKGTLIREKLLLEIFRARRLNDLFLKKANAIIKRMKLAKLNVWNYLETMHVYYSLYYYAATQKFITAQSYLVQASNALKTFNYLTLLKLDCEVQIRSKLFQENRIDLLSSIPVPELKADKEQLLLEFYQKFNQFSRAPSNELFENLEKHLISAHKNISLTDNLIFLNILINYSIKRLSEGDSSFIKILFKLYKFAVDNSLSTESGFISSDRFRNVMTIACELGEIHWADKFMKDHLHHIPEKIRTNILPIAKSQFYFAQGRFDTALDCLNQIKSFIDFGYKMQTRLLQLKCYYELKNDYEKIIIPYINSFDNSLLRNKSLNEDVLNRYRNFIKILRLLLRPKHTKIKDDILTILNSKKSIAAKPWLLEKIRSY